MSHNPNMETIDSDDRLIDRTLGYDAVFFADSAAHVATHMSELATTPEMYESLEAAQQRLGELALQDVERARAEIGEVASVKGVKAINEYFATSVSPYFEKLRTKHRETTGRNLTWQKWLTDENAVPNETLLNVLQWHNTVIEQQLQSPEIRDAYTQFQTRFLAEATALHDEGMTSQPPRDLDTLTLAPADVFSTSAKSIGGYYDSVMAPTEVALPQGIGRTLPEQEVKIMADFGRALTHELVHAYMNESFQDTTKSPLRVSWVNESLTEEISQMIRRRMDPTFEADTTYGKHRALLHTLLSPGNYYDEQLFTEAVQAYTGTTQQRADLVDHIDTAWGTHDAIGHIDRAVNTQYESLQQLTKVNKTLFRREFESDDNKVYARAIELVNTTLLSRPAKILE